MNQLRYSGSPRDFEMVGQEQLFSLGWRYGNSGALGSSSVSSLCPTHSMAVGIFLRGL